MHFYHVTLKKYFIEFTLDYNDICMAPNNDFYYYLSVYNVFSTSSNVSST